LLRAPLKSVTTERSITPSVPVGRAAGQRHIHGKRIVERLGKHEAHLEHFNVHVLADGEHHVDFDQYYQHDVDNLYNVNNLNNDDKHDDDSLNLNVVDHYSAYNDLVHFNHDEELDCDNFHNFGNRTGRWGWNP